jgi:hypothetical protein
MIFRRKKIKDVLPRELYSTEFGDYKLEFIEAQDAVIIKVMRKDGLKISSQDISFIQNAIADFGKMEKLLCVAHYIFTTMPHESIMFPCFDFPDMRDSRIFNIEIMKVMEDAFYIKISCDPQHVYGDRTKSPQLRLISLLEEKFRYVGQWMLLKEVLKTLKGLIKE